MKKTFTITIIGLIMIIAIISLQPTKSANKDLILAEKLMHDRPDSALQILKRLNVNDFKGENRALYALLLTQAQLKNNQFVNSDSIIKIAFDYYSIRNDSFRKAQSYLYQGRIDENIGNVNATLNNYQKASSTILPLKNDSLLSLIYYRWGIFLRKRFLADDAIFLFQKALNSAKSANDTIMQLYILMENGKTLSLQKKYDKALNVYKSALFMAMLGNNKKYVSNLYKNLSVLYKLKEEYDLSMYYLDKSFELKTDSIFVYSSFLLKGELFSLKHQYDSARYYLNLGRNVNDLTSNAAYCSFMSKLEKKIGNYEKALIYLNQYVVYADSFENQSRRSEIMELQKKYDYSLIKNENDKLKISRQQMQIIVLAISLIAIIATFLSLYYFYRKRSFKRAMKLELDKMRQNLINEKSNYFKEKTIEAQRNLIKEQELGFELSQKTEALKQHQERERELKDYIFQMEAIVQKINTFNSMKPLQRSKSESQYTLSFEELNELEEAVNLCFDQYTDRLRTEFPRLKDDDIHLCCLLKMKVPNKNILSLLNTNELTLKKRRYRIKHDKMNLPDDVSSLEEFLLNY